MSTTILMSLMILIRNLIEKNRAILTPCAATKSKNRSVVYGFEVKTHVFLNAELIVAQTPENQYNELKHRFTKANSSFRDVKV